MNSVKTAFFGLLALCTASAGAQIIDTGEAAKAFVFGAHVGINTANRTIGKDAFNTYNHNSWGVGFEAGATADIYLRDYISLQPGLFFQCRSGNFTYINTRDLLNTQTQLVQYGHSRRYNLSIPVLCSVHFNVTNDVRWNVELGPYVQFNLKDKQNDFYMGLLPANYTKVSTTLVDFGFKFGTSLTFCRHYNIGVHYWAGACDPWKGDLGGRNKAWSFTIGYDI